MSLSRSEERIDNLEAANGKLLALVKNAAPIMATLAYKGGSVLAKDWLEDAYELGVERISPDQV